MINLRNKLKVALGSKNEILYTTTGKENLKFSRIAMFGGNILYIFVLHAGKVTIFVLKLPRKW